DGTGNPWYRGDIGIRDGRIAAIGSVDRGAAAQVIDAAGKVVSPGFIDLHTHSDIPLLVDGTAQSAVRQGVTLDVLGESASIAPPACRQLTKAAATTTPRRSSRWRRSRRNTAATTGATSAARAISWSRK